MILKYLTNKKRPEGHWFYSFLFVNLMFDNVGNTDTINGCQHYLSATSRTLSLGRWQQY